MPSLRGTEELLKEVRVAFEDEREETVRLEREDVEEVGIVLLGVEAWVVTDGFDLGRSHSSLQDGLMYEGRVAVLVRVLPVELSIPIPRELSQPILHGHSAFDRCRRLEVGVLEVAIWLGPMLLDFEVGAMLVLEEAAKQLHETEGHVGCKTDWNVARLDAEQHDFATLFPPIPMIALNLEQPPPLCEDVG